MRVFASLIASLYFCFAAVGQDFAAIPPLSGRVVDVANVLSASEISQLDSKLASAEKEKGAQFVILLVKTTAPESIEQYSFRVVENWKLGRKGIDDGILLLLAMEDKAFRMEVGYGLEGALSDVVTKRILEEVLKPYLRKSEVANGLNATADAVAKVISGEELPAPNVSAYSNDEDLMPLIIALVMGGVFFSTLLRALGVSSLGTASMIGASLTLVVSLFLLPFILGLLASFFTLFLSYFNSNSSGGYYSGGRSSGGWSSGGGGGFSGGGGSFGGGGSSGRW
jgi:uncharacterized protein